MIKSRFEKHMTQPMLDELAYMNSFIEADINLCIQKINDIAPLEDLRLPATAASGEPVVHGARLMMFDIQVYWIKRLSAALQLLPIDEARAIVRKHNIDNHIARQLGI